MVILRTPIEAKGAKEAFLLCKEEEALSASNNNQKDTLASFKRYKIVNTDTLTLAQAEAYITASQQKDLGLRPNCLACLILTGERYLFFRPFYRKQHV